MRVGVVGGGVSGLYASYLLQSEGVDVELYEEESFCGGRVRNADVDGVEVPVGAQLFGEHYSEFKGLVTRFGLGGQIEQVELDKSALYLDGDFVGLTPLSLVATRRLGFGAKWDLRSFLGDLERLDSWRFPLTLFEVSLAEYVEETYGSEVLEKVVEPVVRFFFQTSKELAAAVGLQYLKVAQGMQRLRGGNARIAYELTESLGDQVKTESEVTRILGSDEGFVLETEEGEYGYDAVVCAVPLPQAKEVFVEGEVPDLEYASVTVSVVQGERRFGDVDVVLNGQYEDNSVYGILRHPSYYVVFSEEEDPDLEPFFTNSRMVEEVYWRYALPKIGPGRGLPGITTGLGDAYVIGDFYLGGRMESALRSAKAAVKLLTR